MPRQPRAVAVGYPHHITQRGNNREPVFLDQDDYLKYLELLQHFASKHELNIWAYCLMPNHVHLLVVPGRDESLAKGIGLTNMTYTQYFNSKYEHSGRIWQNRFFSCIVGENDYLLSVVRYIELNPVKAGLVGCPEDYSWSSARTHCHGEKNSLLSSDEWFSTDLRTAYRKSIAMDGAQQDDAIRKATQAGKVFGSMDLLKQLEDELRITLTSRPRGRPAIK